MPINELLAGLARIQGENPDAPIVTAAYVITVPAVKAADMSPSDQADMVSDGWLIHPVYLSYYYPAQTVVELAPHDLTGENAGDIPVIEPMVPPLPKTK